MNKPCDMHENPELDYRTAHADAKERARRGEQQRTCPKCKKHIWESQYYDKWWLGVRKKLPPAVEEFYKGIYINGLNPAHNRVVEQGLTHPDSPIKLALDAAEKVTGYEEYTFDEMHKAIGNLDQALAALKSPQSTERGHTEEE